MGKTLDQKQRKSDMKDQVMLPESAEYEMSYFVSDEDVDYWTSLFREHEKSQKLTPDYPKTIEIKFRGERDANKFCCLVSRDINYDEKIIEYVANDQESGKKHTFQGIAPVRKQTNRDQTWREYWTDMPDFNQEKKTWVFHSVKVKCETREDYISLAFKLRQFLRIGTTATYHPSWSASNHKQFTWKSKLPSSEINPKYPVFIISKGRAYSRLTSKALEAMNVPYFVVVEPAEYDTYATVIDEEKILQLPFDSDPNYRTGPGRARNWCWDYAKGVLKVKRHWVMDDNIEGFYRLNNNRRITVSDGAMFKAMEDFVDRFDNVRVAGPNYRFFATPKEELPAFVANTRIYSCLLIDNDCKHRWRERYNEDTILALDILKDGDCSIQFNAFLQGKVGTQKLKGGNTEEFYHAEGDDYDEDKYNATGTINKSVTLKNAFPDEDPDGNPLVVVKVQYKRVHHWVDYSWFKGNELILNDFQAPADPEYGMELIDRYE